MPIRIYQPQARIEPFQIGQPAVQGAPLDVANTPQNVMAREGAASLAGVAKAVGKELRERQEVQQATDILSATTAYQDATRAFESDYRKNNQGANARDAADAWGKWHTEQMQQLGQQFAGDPRLSYLWQRHAEQVRESSLNRAQAYADQQDDLYRQDTIKARVAMFMQQVPEVGDDDARLNNLRSQLNTEIAAMSPGRDLTATMADIDRQVGVARINTALAQKNLGRADQLIAYYRPVLGMSYDDILVRREGASNALRSDEARKIAMDTETAVGAEYR